VSTPSLPLRQFRVRHPMPAPMKPIGILVAATSLSVGFLLAIAALVSHFA
jgi:hypothetical protein